MALEPAITGEILELHHAKHHAAYVKGADDTLEKLAEARDKGEFGGLVGLEKTFAFNLSGHVLHTIFWQNLSPDGGDRPDGELGDAIVEHFGSFEAFQKQLTTATTAGRVPKSASSPRARAVGRGGVWLRLRSPLLGAGPAGCAPSRRGLHLQGTTSLGLVGV